MNIDISIQRIVHEIQYLHAAQSEQTHGQPKLVVIHGYHQPGTSCLPGETIEQIYLIAEGRWIALRTSDIGSALIDLFARKRNRALTATQIENFLATDPFLRRLGANAKVTKRLNTRLKARTVRVYLWRLGERIGRILARLQEAVNPLPVLISERTEAKATVYHFGISLLILHADADGRILV